MSKKANIYLLMKNKLKSIKRSNSKTKKVSLQVFIFTTINTR